MHNLSLKNHYLLPLHSILYYLNNASTANAKYPFYLCNLYLLSNLQKSVPHFLTKKKKKKRSKITLFPSHFLVKSFKPQTLLSEYHQQAPRKSPSTSALILAILSVTCATAGTSWVPTEMGKLQTP